jgi:hypothetical protein
MAHIYPHLIRKFEKADAKTESFRKLLLKMQGKPEGMIFSERDFFLIFVFLKRVR